MIRGLFCGVSEYRANQELSYCVNDAKKMKETFIDTFVCSDNSIEILAENGSIENLEYIKKVKEFSEKCSEDDIAVIYYSGHGGIDDDGSNYLYATNTFDGNNTKVIILHIRYIGKKTIICIGANNWEMKEFKLEIWHIRKIQITRDKENIEKSIFYQMM